MVVDQHGDIPHYSNAGLQPPPSNVLPESPGSPPSVPTFPGSPPSVPTFPAPGTPGEEALACQWKILPNLKQLSHAAVIIYKYRCPQSGFEFTNSQYSKSHMWSSRTSAGASVTNTCNKSINDALSVPSPSPSPAQPVFPPPTISPSTTPFPSPVLPPSPAQPVFPPPAISPPTTPLSSPVLPPLPEPPGPLCGL